jgi:flagellar motor component MotA
MAEKKLQKDSIYAHLDKDGDGIVSDEEMMMEQRMIELEDMRSDMENEDKKQDAQRNMAWFALFGMLLYPAFVIVATLIGLDQAASILGDMAAVYFVSVAAIVAAFYGKEAIAAKTPPKK